MRQVHQLPDLLMHTKVCAWGEVWKGRADTFSLERQGNWPYPLSNSWEAGHF